MLNNTVTSTVDTSVVCASCGVTVDVATTVYNWEGKRVCLTCQKDRYTTCDCCDCLYPRGTTMTPVTTELGCAAVACPNCLDVRYERCSVCEQYHHINDMMETADGDTICAGCYEQYYSTCDHCGRIHHVDTTSYAERLDMYLCEDCLAYSYTTCDRCDHIVRDTDTLSVVVSDSGDVESWCSECYNNDGYTCSECGSCISEAIALFDDGDCFCPACHTPGERRNVIKNYHYHKGKLNEIFYTDTDNRTEALTFGMELELDVGGLDHDNAFELLSCFRNSEVVAEKDGSLHNGFELITYPFSRDYYYKSLRSDLSEACSKAIDMGYRSHDTTTCGLHIHVGRAGLGATAEEREKTIAKLWLLMYRFQKQLVVFSRRSKEALARYADMPIPSDLGVESLAEIDTAEKLYVKAKDNLGRRGRYVALNLTNEKTIEVRIFKGTLNVDTITASLQLVHNMVYLAKILSALDCQSMTWEDLRRLLILDVPELEAYLTKKAL